MKIWTFLLAGFAFGTVAIADDFDLASKMINTKTNGTWYILPDKPKAQHIKADVLGGYAFRVKAHKSANPWDVQATSPVEGAINQGDVIVIMYYARAEKPAEGGSSLTVRVQLNAPPWTSTLETSSKITSEWTKYCAAHVATTTVPEKTGTVSIHLATADQIIDLGPVLVFNFGPGFDTHSLGDACSG